MTLPYLAIGPHVTSGGTTLSVTVQAHVVQVVRQAGGTGWPTELIKGDAYTIENGAALQITIKDLAGNALTQLGSTAFSSGDVFRFNRVGSSDQTADFVGVLTWQPPLGETDGFYILEITDAEMAKPIVGVEYRGQLILAPGTANQRVIASACFDIGPSTTS